MMLRRTSTCVPGLARRARPAPMRTDTRSASNWSEERFEEYYESIDTPKENWDRRRGYGPEGFNRQALRGLNQNVPPITSCDLAFKNLTKKPAYLSHESSFFLLPWGLVPQKRVKDKVAPQHEGGIHTSDGVAVYNSSETMDSLLELTGGREHLCEGARGAYLYLASLWNGIPRTLSFYTMWDTISIRLAEALEVCSFAYYKAGMNPLVDIAEVKVDLLNIWIEEGSVHRPKKFAMFDWYEIKHNILSRIVGPELRLLSGKNILGKPPRHLCAAFRIKSVDTLGVRLEGSGEIIKGSPRSSRHYWVMETDWRSESLDPDVQNFQWRIRNINSAIRPLEKPRLPLDAFIE